ncbi:EH domain-binding protein 1 [Aphelenchoides fujianensis]|nr:EH domain-binding protein 1 [Aphelenchoides fujianensis]
MSLLLRKFRRAKKKAAKFRFNISCKELVFDCAPKWRPEKIVIACSHRRRRHEIAPRRPDWSFEQPTRAMVAWTFPPSCCKREKSWKKISSPLASGLSTPLPEAAITAADSQPAEQKKEVVDEIARVSDEINTFVDAAQALEDFQPLIPPASSRKKRSQRLMKRPRSLGTDRKKRSRKKWNGKEEPEREEEVEDGGRNVVDFTTSTPDHVNLRKAHPRFIPHSPILPSPVLPSPPPVVPGEPLITWCMRVTKGYKNVSIRDFAKLDESVVTLPDKGQILKFVDDLRGFFEGRRLGSSLFQLSEGEVTLLDDFELMKQSRLQDSEDSAVLDVNLRDPSAELHEIAVRLKHIEKLDAELRSRQVDIVPGSKEEKRLFDQIMELLEEKEELVERQDAINKTLSY